MAIHPRLRNALDRFLAIRERSVQEVRQYLHRKILHYALEKQDVEKILAELAEMDLLDDERFAQRWIESRMRLKHRGKKYVQQELMQKGIDRDIIEKTLQQLPQENELESAISLLEKRMATIKKLDIREQKHKAYTILHQRGYSSDVIRSAVDALLPMQ